MSTTLPATGVCFPQQQSFTGPSSPLKLVSPHAGKRQHIAALDGVRGLALLLVFADHFLMTNDVSRNPAVQAVLDLKDMTWTGVYLFFALSGFLITGILYDTLDAKNYFAAFYGRRVLRIFPLYYGVLLLLALLTIPLHLHWQGEQWMLWTYTPNLIFHRQFEANPASWLNLRHFWSLAIEEQFYLAWPIVVFLVRSWKGIMTAAVIGSLFSLGLRTWLLLHGQGSWFHSTPCALDALLPGGMLALLVRSRFRERVLRWGTPVFLACLAILLLQDFRPLYFHPSAQHAFHPDCNLFLGTLGMPVVAIGYTALIAASLQPQGMVQRFFAHRFLRFFGIYSYGLYVLHYSLHQAFTWRLRHLFEQHHLPEGAAILLTFLLLVGLSTALAYASYHLYEKHLLRLKRFFPYRYASRSDSFNLAKSAQRPDKVFPTIYEHFTVGPS